MSGRDSELDLARSSSWTQCNDNQSHHLAAADWRAKAGETTPILYDQDGNTLVGTPLELFHLLIGELGLVTDVLPFPSLVVCSFITISTIIIIRVVPFIILSCIQFTFHLISIHILPTDVSERQKARYV